MDFLPTDPSPTSAPALAFPDVQRLLLDSHPGIALLLDDAGRVAWANAAAGTRLGGGPEGLAGRAFAGDLVEADAVQRRAVELTDELEAEVAADVGVLTARDRFGGEDDGTGQEWLLRHADGSPVPVMLHTAVVRDPTGRPTGLLVVEGRLPSEVPVPFHHHDTLTGLPNRAVLADRAEMALQRAARQKTVVALLAIEIAGFDALCEARGHGVGSDILRATASRLHFELRKTDTAVRLDRGQFVAMLVDLRHADEARLVADKLLQALSARINVGVALLTLDIRIGIAWSPDHGDQLLPLLQAADAALAALPGGGSAVGVASAAGADDPVARERDADTPLDASA